ncbi:MAG: LPS export ABC transporter permease LptG [Succinivibrionaceae bacterium]|nr:LPS export ABC transporter permease LptG [Ruminobacter sp.]MDY5778434.1 LPS export ABC transporter permease LptG [Succinivibrionaceae bacterium]MEE1339484.1 LPS export ABC transporter permease LptG [Succinivibrionaceae bacterium]
MFSILDRYIARSVISMVVCCTLGLVALSSLIKFVDEIRHVGRGSFDMMSAIICVGYTVPTQIEMFFPLGVLLGTVLALGSLASSSELIVMQSLSKSRLSIVLSACKGILPLIVIVVLISEYVAPKAELAGENYYMSVTTQGRVSVTSSGVWFKEGDDFINISQVLNDGSMRGIKRYTFTNGDEKKLVKLDYADVGTWNGSAWVMTNVSTRFFTDTKIGTKTGKNVPWNLLLTPDKVGAIGINASELSARDLYNYISYMKSNGQRVDDYLLAFYRKIVNPFMVLVVVLLGASTVFGPLRSASVGARVVVGIVVGFVFYAVNEILAPFTIFYGVPPIVGATLPTSIVLVVAIYLLRKRT